MTKLDLNQTRITKCRHCQGNVEFMKYKHEKNFYRNLDQVEIENLKNEIKQLKSQIVAFKKENHNLRINNLNNNVIS